MVTFLSGGTGTPKLLSGADRAFAPEETTVIGNTGEDLELGGLLVCPDLDTVLFERGGVLDRETWWGIEDDTHATHDSLRELAEVAGLKSGPQYLPDERQTAGRELARWRRFSAVGEFMTIGDRDRAVHLTRTSLIDQDHTLTEVTRTLADAFDLAVDLVPMSDDPLATIIATDRGEMHFQEFWVGHGGEPAVESVEFRGDPAATKAVRRALDEPVVIGPSNPVTSVGPIREVEGIEQALSETPVVAVSPFIEDRVFSGPADDLMAAMGYEPSTAGMAEAYPFADAFVLDSADGTDLDRPIVRTDTAIDTPEDAARVARTAEDALEVVA